ncbi:C-GCAxxG-C-C family (seleno)protein [Desulfurivibrio sp. D14AmB]|uniref:C-GCAxxG-C-C family (seleno)protein n=1 Tax=Desulfurivibrio sp. D14AmB TaxID=3374370 RepID=UPI00376EBA43
MKSHEMKDEGQGDLNVPRRNLLVGAGALAAGMLLTKAGGLLGTAQAKAQAITETWPWPYVKLDPDETAELAYNEWYRVYCGAGVFSSIFSQLREKVGEPYTLIPIDAFIFLEGGMVGWGTICGSNAGANLVTNMIIGPRTAGSDDGMLMGSEIMQWYSDTQLPTYKPKNPRISAEIPTTISNSPLCHVSVGRWMKATGKHLGSDERRDRCARVTASVAHQTVTLLNQWHDGKYRTKGTIPAASYGIQTQHNCTSCHGSNVPMPPMAKR